jgi:hypothetical protein
VWSTGVSLDTEMKGFHCRSLPTSHKRKPRSGSAQNGASRRSIEIRVVDQNGDSLNQKRDWVQSELSQASDQIRIESGLGSQGRTVRLKIYCELLKFIVITGDGWLYREWAINPFTNPSPVLYVTHTHDSMLLKKRQERLIIVYFEQFAL